MCGCLCVCGRMRLEQTLGTRFCTLKILLLLLLRSQTKKHNRSHGVGDGIVWGSRVVGTSGQIFADLKTLGSALNLSQNFA